MQYIVNIRINILIYQPLTSHFALFRLVSPALMIFFNRLLVAIGDKVGYGDGRQDTDDSNNNHQSGNCKTCIIHPSHFAVI